MLGERTMEDVIEKILHAGVQAPSGGNSQPWNFKVADGAIDVFYLPEKDHPILNFKNRGTMLAHGALLENMRIAANAFGYEAKCSFFPDKNQPKLLAHIVLEKTNPKPSSLMEAIFERETNRKPYSATPINTEEKAALMQCSNNPREGTLKLVDNLEEVAALGKAVSINEVVMFENPELHRLFFKEVVWTEDQEKKKGGGLYIKTLELKPPQEAAMKLFRLWFFMKLANKLGMSKMIAKDNAKVYSTAPMMGIIEVEDKDEAFISAGALMERLWLTATSLGLSFHLITGIFFIDQRIRAGEAKELSDEHKKLVTAAYKDVANVFGVKNKIISVLFRIGHGDKPTAKSIKLPAQMAN